MNETLFTFVAIVVAGIAAQYAGAFIIGGIDEIRSRRGKGPLDVYGGNRIGISLGAISTWIVVYVAARLY